MHCTKIEKAGCTVCWKRCLKSADMWLSPNNVPPAKATHIENSALRRCSVTI
ncbi:hypothetical protein KCP77_16460 [Salmonella enterica subsp. enterica]|nr:hypothetical protein KCP77_16460 [Salmonella enterica subsp. enterica]